MTENKILDIIVLEMNNELEKFEPSDWSIGVGMNLGTRSTLKRYLKRISELKSEKNQECDLMTESRYKQIVEMVAAVKEQRGKMYRTEPKDIVPIEILEAVALLKAYRGYEGIDIDKKIDEYTDLMNYSAFVIERLQDLKSQEHAAAKHVDIQDCMTSSQQTMKVVEGSKPGFVRAVPACFGKYDITSKPCNTGCEVFSSCIYEKSKNNVETFPACFGKQTPDCIESACKSYNDCKMEMRTKLAKNTTHEIIKSRTCNCNGNCKSDGLDQCACDSPFPDPLNEL